MRDWADEVAIVNTFGTRSRFVLGTCDNRLVRICENAIAVIDFAVLSGARTQEEQEFLYAQGRTMPGQIVTWVRYPHGKHCVGAGRDKSAAVDIAPWPIDWDDLDRFRVLGGVMMGVAVALGVDLRWGADWDRDLDLADQMRFDWGHFELVDG